MNLTAAERTVLHISEFWKVKDPILELTQKGIAEAVGLQRGHVPRNLKKLMLEGCIEEAEGRVKGQGRKVKYYKITEAGLRRARQLKDNLLNDQVIYAGGKFSVKDISDRFRLSPLAVALNTNHKGEFLPPPIETHPEQSLIDRDDDIAFIRKWDREGGPVIVVYGALGMGKTTLGKAFVSKLSRPHVWVDVRDGETLDELLSSIHNALPDFPVKEKTATAQLNEISSRGILLVIDGYNQVSEDVVDFLSDSIKVLRGGKGKLMILAQSTTPSYCRFYGRGSLKNNDVWERHIQGLSLDGCKKMLKIEHIEDEAIKRIFLLTKGTPLYLDLIRRGESEELRKKSRFTKAEIRLLMFSRDVAPSK